MTPSFSFATLAYARVIRLHHKEKKEKKQRKKEKLQNPNYSKKSESSLGSPENQKQNAKRYLLDLHGHQSDEFFFFFFFF